MKKVGYFLFQHLVTLSSTFLPLERNEGFNVVFSSFFEIRPCFFLYFWCLQTATQFYNNYQNVKTCPASVFYLTTLRKIKINSNKMTSFQGHSDFLIRTNRNNLLLPDLKTTFSVTLVSLSANVNWELSTYNSCYQPFLIKSKMKILM